MNCGQSRKLFSAYWDDELTQGEREWFELHISACTVCRHEYEQFARTLELTGALPRIEAQPDLAERVLARARRVSPAPDRLPVGTKHWIPALATVALVVISSAAIVLTSIAPDRAHRDAPARTTAAVPEPVLEHAPGATPAATPSTGSPLAASVTDSLFDHSEDVEFILDPVTVRKGRAHPASRLAPQTVRGEQAVITF